MKNSLIVLLLFFLMSESSFASKKARTIYLNNNRVENIWVRPNKGVVISFPTKPKKAIFGAQGHYGIEYVDNDLIIAALRPGANTNLHVYLDGRRFSFNLITSLKRFDDIIQARDSKDRKYQVELK